MPQQLRTSVEDAVGILALDHPRRRNALGWELHEEIIATLDATAWTCRPCATSRSRPRTPPSGRHVPAGTLRESSLRLARRIAGHGAELTTVLKEVALRAGHMDHVAATAYELRVTHDLLQRGLFTERLVHGIDRLKAGESLATPARATPASGGRERRPPRPGPAPGQ